MGADRYGGHIAASAAIRGNTLQPGRRCRTGRADSFRMPLNHLHSQLAGRHAGGGAVPTSGSWEDRRHGLPGQTLPGSFPAIASALPLARVYCCW